jgi:hypothetical protein
VGIYTVSRGIRNNNPGNIRHGADWEGLSKNQMDRNFCQFIDVKYGIRAIFKIIKYYRDNYNIFTISKIIYKWAPPGDNNDTDSYIKSVVSYMNNKEKKFSHAYNDESEIDDKNNSIFVMALIKHENGECPFSIKFISSCKNLT